MLSNYFTDLNQTKPSKRLFADIIVILCIAFFAVQPLNIYHADAIWLFIALLSLAHLSISKYKKHDYKLPKNVKAILYTLAIIPAISITSYLLSPLNTLKPFQLEADLRFWLLIPIIITLIDIRIKPKLFTYCLMAYSITAFGNAAIETHGLTALHVRTNGNENAVPFGMFTATVFALLLSELFDGKNKSKLYLAAVTTSTLVALFVTILSGSRAAIALIVILPIIIVFIKNPVRQAISYTLTFIVFAVLIFTLIPNTGFKDRILDTPHRIKHYLNNPTSQERGSLGARIDQWKEAWCIFKKYPVLGTGPRSFRNAHQAYGGKNDCNGNQPQEYYQLKGGSYQAHSLYFNTLATTGLTGMFFIGLLFFYILKLGKDTGVKERGFVYLTLIIIAHTINGLTLDLWFRNHVIDKNLIILAIPIALATIDIIRKKNRKKLTTP